MKIVVLSRNPRGYSVARFKEAAQKRGHTLRVRNPLKFSMYVEPQTPDLTYNGKTFGEVDAVIPRIGASITHFGTAVVRQFEQMGVFCVNTATAINVSRDKLRSMQILSRHEIGIPDSAFVRGKEDVLPAIESLGGVPVIIKLLEGSQGVGVILADNVKIAEAIIETLQSARQNVLLQKFVKESKGKDIRAFVVGGKVVAAMRRKAAGGEFRSNVHRGGSTEAVELDEQFQQTAVRAAQIMGLRVAGVDMLESKDGPQVMEVNSSPGLEGIEAATGVDIAGAMIEHIEEQVLFPDVDIRQRMTIKSGYGVAEIPVNRESALANVTIGDSGLRDDKEVLVLSITRGSTVIPAPHGKTDMLPGDTLLCFGKLITLRTLVPAQPAKPPRKKRKRNK
jgi:ribosomal protein S6--L-glutamate ligase